MTVHASRAFRVRVRIDGVPHTLLLEAASRADALRQPMADLHRGDQREYLKADDEAGTLIVSWINVATLEVEPR